MTFHLNVQDDNDDVYVTKPMLVIIRVRMLHFTRQYKDTLQMRLTILISLQKNRCSGSSSQPFAVQYNTNGEYGG